MKTQIFNLGGADNLRQTRFSERGGDVFINRTVNLNCRICLSSLHFKMVSFLSDL